MWTNWRLCRPTLYVIEISADIQEKRGKENRGNGVEKEENGKKGRWEKKLENWKWKEGKLESAWPKDPVFFVFCFWFCFFWFCFVFLFVFNYYYYYYYYYYYIFYLFIYFSFYLFFSLFKSTEICFGSTTMGIFTGKKNQEKWLCPLWKIFLLCPFVYTLLQQIFVTVGPEV